MKGVRLVDSHTHVVASDEGRYPFTPRSLSGEWYRDAPCAADQFVEQLDACGVAAAVLVQPVGAYSYDNSYTADSAARLSDRFASACCIDAEAVDAVDRLTYWVRDRGMHGVRLFALSREGPSWLDSPATFPVWERAAMLGAHVIVTIFQHQLPELRAVLEAFPEVPVSLDHCGFPELESAPWDAARELFALAEMPNLHCKVTSNVIGLASAKGARPGDFISTLVGHYGAERVMWGSDFCQTHDRTYADLVALARDAFGDLAAADQAACLGGTAARLWPVLRETEAA
jgi:L-fuconolactonase